MMCALVIKAHWLNAESRTTRRAEHTHRRNELRAARLLPRDAQSTLSSNAALANTMCTDTAKRGMPGRGEAARGGAGAARGRPGGRVPTEPVGFGLQQLVEHLQLTLQEPLRRLRPAGRASRKEPMHRLGRRVDVQFEWLQLTACGQPHARAVAQPQRHGSAATEQARVVL